MYWCERPLRRGVRTLLAALLACGLVLCLPAGAAWAAQDESQLDVASVAEGLANQEVPAQDGGSIAPDASAQDEGFDENALPAQDEPAGAVAGSDAQGAQQPESPAPLGVPEDIPSAEHADGKASTEVEGPSVEAAPTDAEVEVPAPRVDATCEDDAESLEAPGATGGEAAVEDASDLSGIQAVATEEHTTQDGLPAAPAKAVALDEGTYVFQSEIAANRVVKAKSAKSGAELVTATYAKGKTQRWVLVREGSSLWYRILSAENENLALVVSTDKAGNRVVKLTSAKAAAKGALLKMLWSFVDVGKGARQLVNASCPELRLGMKKASKKTGTKMTMVAAKAASAKSQRMKVLNAKPKVRAGSTVDDGSYFLRLSGSVLVAEGDSKGASKKHAAARLATSSGSPAQRIYLERTSDGYYVAWVQGTGKVLDVASTSILAGTEVCQRAYSGGSRQKWALTTITAQDGSVSYRLQNKATGLYLGATSGKEGTSLASRAAGEAYSSFDFEPTSLLGGGVYAMTPRESSAVCVQVRKQSTGTAGLVLWASNGSLGQRFELVQAGGVDLWRIRTGSSGGWLTWAGGSKVEQQGSSKTAASASNTWHAIWTNGGVALVNVACERAGKLLALDTSRGKTTKGTSIVVRPSKGLESQHFAFEPTQLLGEGYYFLRNGGSTFMKVKDSSLKNGAGIQVTGKVGTASQLFQVEHKGAYTRIKNVYSGKYLQISANAAGANVTQRKENNSKKQLWKSVIVDGGYVQIVSAANASLVLDAANAGGKEGAAVRVATTGRGNGQVWRPVSLSAAVNVAKTSRQQAVVRSCKRTPSPGKGLCAAWVSSVIANAGIGSWNGDACDLYRNWCKSTDLTKLRPGMIVAVSTHSHTPAGKIWGHVCVYVGNGMIMDNVGPIRTMSLFDWIAWYGDRVQPKWGWLGGARLR